MPFLALRFMIVATELEIEGMKNNHQNHSLAPKAVENLILEEFISADLECYSRLLRSFPNSIN